MYNRSSSHEELLSELAKQNDLWLHCKTEPDNCWLLVQGTDMRLCTAEVHEAEKPRKLGRGVELRRIEVSFSFFHK